VIGTDCISPINQSIKTTKSHFTFHFRSASSSSSSSSRERKRHKKKKKRKKKKKDERLKDRQKPSAIVPVKQDNKHKYAKKGTCHQSPVYVEKRGINSVCINNGTRGQCIARLKLPVDIAKMQASFNYLFYIANIFQIIITISKQVPNYSK
jgi:hypothetical protein